MTIWKQVNRETDADGRRRSQTVCNRLKTPYDYMETRPYSTTPDSRINVAPWLLTVKNIYSEHPYRTVVIISYRTVIIFELAIPTTVL